MAMTKSTRSQMTMLLAATAVLLLRTAAPAADLAAGKIRAIDSADPAAVAKIVRIGYAGIIAGNPGDAVFAGDTVKTADGVRVQIELSDRSVVTVAPGSALQMKAYQVDASQGTRNSVMRTLKGTVRFVIAKYFKPSNVAAETKWKESNVTIESTNVVAGVRGTDVVVTSQGAESEIAVFDGSMSVRHASPKHKDEAVLAAGQFSSVTKDLPPSPPAALSPERREALEKATTLVNPRMAAVAPKGDGKKTKTCDEKDVANDLSAGTPLAEVIDKAVGCGVPLAAVIGVALDSGVAPSTVVYTAVTEGYSAKDVVTAAIEHGAPLTQVAAAAIGAGADRSLVISGATDAGVPPPAIATAIAAATSPNASVYGGSTPMDSAPASIIPESPASGGGGGTPSTQPASPYRP